MLYNSRYNVKTKNEDNKKNSQKNKLKSFNEKSKLILKAKQQLKLNTNNQLSENNNKKQLSKKPLTRNVSFTNKFLKCRFANKRKTLELNRIASRQTKLKQKSHKIAKPLPPPPYEYKIANRLGQAIKKDDLPKPTEHLHVRQVVVKALKEGISWPTIECLLHECGWQQKINENCFLLEICFHKVVFLILSIRTNNILKFKKHLLQMLKRHDAKYESILHYFRHNCRIEALASYKTSKQFASFEKTLAKDAIECQAKSVEILDYETGAVNLKCHPIQLPAMVEKLEKRQYKILYTDYGFKALHYINLDENVRQNYIKFLNELKNFHEVENFFDNVKIVTKDSSKN